MSSNRHLLPAVFAAGLIGAAVAVSGAQAATSKAVDLGSVATAGSNSTLSVTVPMKLRDPAGLDAVLQALYTPGNPQFHRFLSKEEFSRRFGPDAATVSALTRFFQSQGLSVTRTATTQLRVAGSTAAVQAVFGVQLHDFQVPATATSRAYRYHAPLREPRIAPEISAAVHGVLGLDSRPRFRSQLVPAAKRPDVGAAVKRASTGGPGTTINPYGLLTVSDFTQYYDVEPLYQSGLNGANRTIGIVTLAAFTAADAFKYWDSLGLTTDPKRIKEVLVDGGSGPASDVSGSDETALDVEQSGGIAPAAKIIVYEAPNTDQGWLDAYAASVDDNTADTVSTSWLCWEFFESKDDPEDSTVTSPVNGRQAAMLNALHDVLTQAAVQGQSEFAASGDFGAYTATGLFIAGFPQDTLSVAFPASDTLITAAGGTTLPNGPFLGNAAEWAWGWDYLGGFDFFYPTGGGGGVSSYFARPLYQLGIPGMVNTAPRQVFTDFDELPPELIATLPANFAGRNLPDISLNSDPETGYTIFYTSDVNGFEVETFFGGTSFASPQLNGMTALFDQALGKRLGLLNYALYGLARTHQAYSGPNPPLRDITGGDNWGYAAIGGYDQATGLGVPDVANLLRVLKHNGF
jgi:kumamolisin